ncbi:MAG: hypothetical protein D3905_13740, partial [Candidatus Electrothrix sp. AS4_5]|nr:hypothetical protein [Candidatus Electrothrix gigas]
TIRFDLENEAKQKIYIIDDGKGMNHADLINKWLFVAFSAKKDIMPKKENTVKCVL